MKQHLNTLFITTQGAYLHKQGETVVVKVEKQTKLRLPLHNLGGIVCFGRVGCSPFLMGKCAEVGVAISFHTESGRFLAAINGFSPGNVLLRREQYRRADDIAVGPGGEAGEAARIVQSIVVAKLLNSRAVLRRAMRDYPDAPNREELENAARRIGQSAEQARATNNIDGLRGVEGEAANDYFRVFGHLVSASLGDAKQGWSFEGRSRRPPRDAFNALLSFLYTLLMHDARSACESAGLDAAVGFLHRDRPGRPSLALDLMEELRAFLADRLALSLINRRQIHIQGFKVTEAGGVIMDEPTRKVVLAAYQKRKQEMLTHPFLGEKTTVGLLVHLQARLLARYLRGDLDAYPPFIWK